MAKDDSSGKERMLFSPAAAAHMLSVGRTTLYTLLDQGELQSIKIGRLCRIPRSELEGFISRKQNGAEISAEMKENRR